MDTNRVLARRLGISLRETSRRVTGAMERAGAKTRFQWGHLVGLAEGRADSE